MPLSSREVAGETVGVDEGGIRAKVACGHPGCEGLHVREHAVASKGHEEGVEAAERGEWGVGVEEEVGEAAEVSRRGGGSRDGGEETGDRNGQGHGAESYGTVGIAEVEQWRWVAAAGAAPKGVMRGRRRWEVDLQGGSSLRTGNWASGTLGRCCSWLTDPATQKKNDGIRRHLVMFCVEIDEIDLYRNPNFNTEYN
jgi:hypothetical protein